MLVFPRIDIAITMTLKYYSPDRIAEQINKFKGKPYLNHLDNYHEWVMQSHRSMADEIEQTIVTSNANAQMIMFEDLKLWLNDWRIREVNKNVLFKIISDYNEERCAIYETRIKQDEEVFKAGVDYGRPHGEKSERTTTPIEKTLSFYPQASKTHSWFYCNDADPGLIDLKEAGQYYVFLNEIVKSFRSTAAKYVSRYDAGKISSSLTIPKQHALIQPSDVKLLDNSSPREQQKLKFKLSVPQLAYLFKLFFDSGLLDVKSKTELKKFMLANFSTNGTDEISEKSLENKLSTTEKAEANFWADKFLELQRAAKKV